MWNVACESLDTDGSVYIVWWAVPAVSYINRTRWAATAVESVITRQAIPLIPFVEHPYSDFIPMRMPMEPEFEFSTTPCYAALVTPVRTDESPTSPFVSVMIEKPLDVVV